MTDLAVLAAVVALSAVIWWWWRRRDGHVRAARGHVPHRLRDELGAGEDEWVLLLFTAPSCVPCAAARRVLDQLAEERDRVAVVAVDVGERMDLAREHHVLRAPTVLLVDPGDEVVARVSGVPVGEELLAVLDAGQAASAA